MGREFIEYAGRKFWLQTSDRYFQSGVKTDPERLLHRRIWIDNFGPIPPGHEVHHIDEDWRNNDPLNLELLLESDHRSHHALERWKDPAMEALMRAGLENAREAAKAWHASPEGREWHRQNSLQAWKKRPWSLVRCAMCNDEFSTPFPSRAMLCSKACRNKESQAKYRALKTCPQCSTEFSFFKFDEPECCSRACAIRRRHGHVPTRGKPAPLTRAEAQAKDKCLPATCTHCGVGFLYDKHAKKIPSTCSAKCRSLKRWGHSPTTPVEEQLW